ncbi:MAG: SulP family inorganic anion transporter [Planctomycetota bacterium]
MNEESSEPKYSADVDTDVPRGDLRGAITFFQPDLVSGLLVFLIALPLCLGISIASGYPPIAGIFTAIIGSFVATLVSNSELTIKGPAAGLIVISIGCIGAFGGDGMANGWTEADTEAYRSALAVGVAAAVLQIGFGVLRAGILGEFFPLSAVHGMLAAIGVIIIAKQIPVAFGVEATGGPLQLLAQLPSIVMRANPIIALIGVTSLAIMFVWPLVQRRRPRLKIIPGPVIVLLIAIPMGMWFQLGSTQSYNWNGDDFDRDGRFLVEMPDRVFGMFDAVMLPDFTALRKPIAWKWVFMFFVIGSLESLLSAKAVDLMDPWKRKSNMDRDMVAVGIGNLGSAMVGGLPMISEIVRSKANIDNGGHTRFAGMWHGVFLLVCVALIPMVLHRIPMAALAAMLIFTGFRLAHPSEFLNVLKIGREQLLIFCVTLIGVLATDLLVGIVIGIVAKLFLHRFHGVPLGSLWKSHVDVMPSDGGSVRLVAHQSAVFSNWIPIRRQIERQGISRSRNVVLDLSEVLFVDHTVMDKLQGLQRDFERANLSLIIRGLDDHERLADHPDAARRKRR